MIYINQFFSNIKKTFKKLYLNSNTYNKKINTKYEKSVKNSKSIHKKYKK